ncbi:rhodanese-like domain-containing protein [Pelomicrobium methylotrophicum]|uniref:Rhodanese-like domain-containing protein n=1 Tax=Pelomicrobium methylotrophicum TaxID=2602750 RepID=A0A5C7EVI6_9PROT|nr:rhodanese-like domain-containing protein [Pelomicrobium methylotrophicum]TXF12115.1 rhodanese-like domain-containing protein [Pelomicrobium methylotrophicum]
MSAIQHIGSDELAAMVVRGRVQLLDVRTDVEVARGMIEGARHVPLHLLPQRIGELDPGAVTVVYCQSGVRSIQACAYLAAHGFASSYNLKGGIVEWLRSGRTVTVPA